MDSQNSPTLRSLDAVFAALARSSFRQSIRIRKSERDYVALKGMGTVLLHARGFIAQRLVPALPANDGKQTPWRGHPVFVAQHATATCCRGCLATWHGITRGKPLDEAECAHVIAALERWLVGEVGAEILSGAGATAQAGPGFL